MIKSFFKLLLLPTILFVSGHAFALRCGNKLVAIGDHIPKVVSLCGEPDYTETRSISFPGHCNDIGHFNNDSQYYFNRYNYPRNFPNFATCQYRTVDVWIYNFGPRKFMRELIFYRGAVEEINTLEYGY